MCWCWNKCERVCCVLRSSFSQELPSERSSAWFIGLPERHVLTSLTWKASSPPLPVSYSPLGGCQLRFTAPPAVCEDAILPCTCIRGPGMLVMSTRVSRWSNMRSSWRHVFGNACGICFCLSLSVAFLLNAFNCLIYTAMLKINAINQSINQSTLSLYLQGVKWREIFCKVCQTDIWNPSVVPALGQTHMRTHTHTLSFLLLSALAIPAYLDTTTKKIKKKHRIPSGTAKWLL